MSCAYPWTDTRTYQPTMELINIQMSKESLGIVYIKSTTLNKTARQTIYTI